MAEYFRLVKKAEGERAQSECVRLAHKRVLGVRPGFLEEYIVGIEEHVRAKQKDIICGEESMSFLTTSSSSSTVP